ncbi:MAG: DUF2934 domain-containing protein [Rhodocyclaceae bacterium]|nr:DUF2934 domain-containing protein [Rhodocyclaceae bacterium]
MATTTKKADEKAVKPKTAAAAKKPASQGKPVAKPAAKAKAVAKPAAAPKAKPSAAPKAKPVKTTKAAQPVVATGAVRAVAADQRRYYVEVAAYYIAERRGFVGGNPLEDWAAAEAEVERLLTEGVLNA